MIPIIERIDGLPFGRAYKITLGDEIFLLPSVTTILKLIKIEKYEILKKQFSEEKWSKIMTDAAERGNVLHRMLEIFLLEWTKEKNVEKSLQKAQIFAIEESMKGDDKNKRLVEKGRNLFWNFYHDKFWENISEVVENEIFLFTTFKGGWAGASDFVYRDLEGNLIVEDFKSSTFPKEQEDIKAYYLQISAYMFMCSEKYKEVPKMGRIRISNENSNEIQTFVVYDYELKKYLKEFIGLLNNFREMYNLEETYLNLSNIKIK